MDALGAMLLLEGFSEESKQGTLGAGDFDRRVFKRSAASNREG